MTSDQPAGAAAPGRGRPLHPDDVPASRRARLRRSAAWRWGRWPLLASAVLVGLGALAFAYLYATVELPEEPPQVRSSVVLDAQGRELAVLQRDEMRVQVALDEVAPVVVDALIAAEDRSFYDHDGIDPRGIARALRNNLGGGDTQGGSTITQQLVKNEFLSGERSLQRKAKEAVLAIKLDRSADKEEILERYLNTVYFGRGAHGIEAAARTYFDLPASDLAVHQAALLIGLLRAPSSADPSESPQVALERRNSVIDALVEVGDLREDEAELARAVELGAVERTSAVTLQAGVGAHVVEWIRREAIERFGDATVHGGGLTIRTTIDIDQQRAAEEAIAGVLDAPDEPQAALVAVDRSGAVRAHVGGRDFAQLQVDLALGAAGGGTGRQPGSAFKPFVLAAALEDEVATLGSVYRAPGEAAFEVDGRPWRVRNYGGSAYGTVTLEEATERSVNTTYAELVLEVGPARAAEVAASMGIASELDPNPALVLGTEEVSPLELASAYSTLARDGQRIDPFVIESVEGPDGRVRFEADPAAADAIAPETARAVTHALRGVVEEGTGTRAKIDRPMAGKTGTTQGNGDAWFAGYTPEVTAVVWMGFPEGPDRRMDDVQGGPVTGGSLPAEIWRRFAEWVAPAYEATDFPAPPEALLEAPELVPGSLAISPTSGPAGTTVQLTGTGFEPCTDGWSAVLVPGGASTGGEVDGDAISGSLEVPASLGPGRARVVASCDRGRGPEAFAEAWFEVVGPEPPPEPRPERRGGPPRGEGEPERDPTVVDPSRPPKEEKDEEAPKDEKEEEKDEKQEKADESEEATDADGAL